MSTANTESQAAPVTGGAALVAVNTPPDPAAAGNGQNPPAGNGQAAANGQGAAAAAPEWAATLPEPERAVVAAKGWKDPADVVASYRGLETLLGADKAGRAIVKPKDGDPADKERFFAELGRPEKPEGYELDKRIPPGQSPEFASKAAQQFHKLGLTREQVDGIAAWYGEEAAAQSGQISEEFVQQSKVEVERLQRTWGDARASNEESIARGARLMGLNTEQIIRFEAAVGTTAMLTALLEVGKSIREDTMPGGAAGLNNPLGSVAAATAEIERLKGDREFMAKVNTGDVAAKKKWEELYKAAYPT